MNGGEEGGLGWLCWEHYIVGGEEAFEVFWDEP